MGSWPRDGLVGSCGHKRLVEDPLNGAGAAAALHAAAEATVQQAHSRRPRSKRPYDIAYVMVG
jgi:hypothetical protein